MKRLIYLKLNQTCLIDSNELFSPFFPFFFRCIVGVMFAFDNNAVLTLSKVVIIRWTYIIPFVMYL